MHNKSCCQGKHEKQKCGEFEGNEKKEGKVRHLSECNKEFLKRIEEIDKAIAKIQNE